jgi:RNA polymerase sigma-70 factor, ECF subfamily
MLFGEQHARLQAALHALPLDDQLCLRLRSEGLRYREIAKIVGMSLGSVSASLSRSLARLEQADRR